MELGLSRPLTRRHQARRRSRGVFIDSEASSRTSRPSPCARQHYRTRSWAGSMLYVTFEICTSVSESTKYLHTPGRFPSLPGGVSLLACWAQVANPQVRFWGPCLHAQWTLTPASPFMCVVMRDRTMDRHCCLEAVEAAARPYAQRSERTAFRIWGKAV